MKSQSRLVLHLVSCAAAGVLAAGCAPEEAEDDPALPELDTAEAAGREKFIYIPAINSGDDVNPDMLVVVGVDPSKKSEYKKILSRLDLPVVGDNLHHLGYALNQKRIILPGMFSNNIYLIDVSADAKRPKLKRTYKDLVEDTGYLGPHTVSPMLHGEVLVSMLGADTESGGPAGLVRLDDKTGEFTRYFGPGPVREEGEVGADYQYDIAWNEAAGLLFTTTWGWPKFVFGPPWLDGDSVTMWDTNSETVLQKDVIPPAEGFPASGATESDWLHTELSGYMITDDGRIVLWEDDDGDGTFAYHTVVEGLAAPCDMTVSLDDRYLYMTNWFGDQVQQYDIGNRRAPELVGEFILPHPCMIQVSRDGRRLYVTNSVTRAHDDTTDFGSPPKNDQYGLWLLDVDLSGGLENREDDGDPLVDFTDVQKKQNRGPAGPHMILFDPGVPTSVGGH